MDRGCRPADAGATRGPGLLDDLLGARDRSAFTSSQSNAQRSEKSHVRETIGAQSKRPDRLEIPCSIHLSYGREGVFCVSGGLLLDDLLGAGPGNTIFYHGARENARSDSLGGRQPERPRIDSG